MQLFQFRNFYNSFKVSYNLYNFYISYNPALTSVLRESMAKLLKLCGNNSIDELFREELERGVLIALKTPSSHHATVTFLAKIILNGNQNEMNRVHNVITKFLSEPDGFDCNIILRMLNELYIDLPLVWNRYADGMVESIIESGVEMLTNMDYYSIFSKIDPQALWLRSWMHSFNSRSSIFRAFKKTSLLMKIIQIILNVDKCSEPKYIRSYSIVVHSFRVIQYCIPYGRFHSLFGNIIEVVKIIIQKWLFVDSGHLGRDGYEECVFEVLKAAIKCGQAEKVFTDDVITLLVSQLENRYSVQRLLTIVGSLAPLAEVIIEKICLAGVDQKFWLSEDSQELLKVLFRSSQSYKLTKQIPVQCLTEVGSQMNAYNLDSVTRNLK